MVDAHFPKSKQAARRERNLGLILIRSRSLNRLYICVAKTVKAGMAHMRRTMTTPDDLEVIAWAPRVGRHAETLRFRLRSMRVAGKPMSPRAWYSADAIALVRDNIDEPADTSDNVPPSLSLAMWIARLVAESQKGQAAWLHDVELRPPPTGPIGVIPGTQVVEASMSTAPKNHTTEPEKHQLNGDLFPPEPEKGIQMPRWLLNLARGARITR